jgi:hypothetical protein
MFNPLPSDRIGLEAERVMLRNFIGHAAYMDTAIIGRIIEIDRLLKDIRYE